MSTNMPVSQSPRRPSNLFICFAPDQRSFVHDLDEALKKRRRVSDIDWSKAGPVGNEPVYARLDAAETFLFILSPSSVDSTDCMSQLDRAIRSKKSIVVVQRVNVRKLPPPLATFPIIDYRENVDYQLAFEEVITAVNTNLRIDVFLCYSRDDRTFVNRLYNELHGDGRRVWMDLNSIPASTLWEKEIFAGIEAADNFIFIISPSSLRPESFCHKELAHASANNKRIIPLLQQAVNDSDIPPVLAQYERLDFLGNDFKNHFERLLTVIDEDPNYLRNHTRLLTRAIEWDRSRDGHDDRDKSLLLRGTDLVRAEELLVTSATKRQQFTNLQTQYVVASRAAVSRFRNVLLTGAGVVVALLVVLSVLLLFQVRAARAATVQAQNERIYADQQTVRAQTREAEACTSADIASVARDNADAAAVKEKAAHTDAEKRRREADHQRELALAARDRERSAREVAEIRGIRATAAKQEASDKPIDAIVLYRAAAGLAATHGGEKNSGDFERLVQQTALAHVLRIPGIRAKAFSVSSDGKKIAVASNDQFIRIWDLASGKLDPPIQAYKTAVTAVAFSPTDPDLLATMGGDRVSDASLKLWNARDGKQQTPVADPTDYFNRGVLRFVGDHFLASGGNVWDLHSRKSLKLNLPPNMNISAVALSSDAGKVAVNFFRTGGPQNAPVEGAAIYDSLTGERIVSLEGSPDVRDMAFSPDGQYLAAVGSHMSFGVWETTNGKALRLERVQIMTHEPGKPFSSKPDTRSLPLVSRFEFSSKKDGWVHLVTAGPSNEFAEWYIAELACVLQNEVITESIITGLKFSPDGTRLATADEDQKVTIWDAERWVRKQVLKGHQGPTRQISFLANDKIVSSSDDGTIRVWQLPNNLSEKRLQDLGTIRAVSDDGKLAFAEVWNSPDSFEIVDLDAQKPVAPISAKLETLTPVAFSHDGTHLAAMLRDNSVRVWSSSGQPSVYAMGLECYPCEKKRAFSDDMSLMATAHFTDLEVTRTSDNTKIRMDLVKQVSRSIKVIALSHAGDRLAVGYDLYPTGGLVEIYRYSDADKTYQLETIGEEIKTSALLVSLAFSENDQMLAIGDAEGALLLRDNHGKLIPSESKHLGAIDGIVWPRRGPFFATFSKNDHTVKIWNTSPVLSLTNTFERVGVVDGISMSDDGTRMIPFRSAFSSSTVLRAWDTVSGNLLDELEIPRSSADGRPYFLEGGQIVRLANSFSSFSDWRIHTSADSGDEVGRKTNLRPCRENYDAVPVLPYPDSATLWARPEDCDAVARRMAIK